MGSSLKLCRRCSGSGTMSIGTYAVPSAAPGGALTLAVPLCYTLKALYWSNATVSGDIQPYQSRNTLEDYDQTLAGLLADIQITIAAAQAHRFR